MPAQRSIKPPKMAKVELRAYPNRCLNSTKATEYDLNHRGTETQRTHRGRTEQKTANEPQMDTDEHRCKSAT